MNKLFNSKTTLYVVLSQLERPLILTIVAVVGGFKLTMAENVSTVFVKRVAISLTLWHGLISGLMIRQNLSNVKKILVFKFWEECSAEGYVREYQFISLFRKFWNFSATFWSLKAWLPIKKKIQNLRKKYLAMNYLDRPGW